MSTVENRPDEELKAVKDFFEDKQNPFESDYYVQHSPNEIFVWEVDSETERPDFPNIRSSTRLSQSLLWRDEIENVIKEMEKRDI